jgi:hypothetical protein
MAHRCSTDHLGPGFETDLINDLKADQNQSAGLLVARIHQIDDYLALSVREQGENVVALRLFILCCEAGRGIGLSQLKETVDKFLVSDKAKVARDEAAVVRLPAPQAVYQLRSAILRAFGEIQDKRIWRLALILIRDGDKAIRNDSLHYYVEPILISDLEARNTLRMELDNKDADLFQNADLLSLLKKVEESEGGSRRKETGKD